MPKVISKEDLINLYINKKLSLRQTALSLKTNIRTIIKFLIMYGLEVRKPKESPNLIGQKFGKLIVLNKSDINKSKKHKFVCYWNCKCECGIEKIIPTSSLIYNLTKSCGCLRRKRLYKGYKNLSGCYWSRVIRGAKSRNLTVEITIKDAWNLFKKQKQKCALTGLDINLVKDLTKNRIHNTASLDRIDSNKGYVKNNIRWVHKDVNMLKNNYSDEDFIKICILVVKYHNDIKNQLDLVGI